MQAYKGDFPPKHNPDSEFRRIAFVNGVSRESFYQLEQWINNEKAYIYSIDETSYVPHPTKFIERYTIQLINEKGLVYDWYHIKNPINITLQSSHEQYALI